MAGALARVRSETATVNGVRRTVEQVVREVARALIEETQGVRPLPGALSRTVPDGDSAYSVRGSFLDQPAPGVPAIVIVVERRPSDPPAAEEIRHGLGLTRKQATVARLLAVGLTNTQIAAELSISEHTARHHTENIMAKLGCRTRAAVAQAIFSLES